MTALLESQSLQVPETSQEYSFNGGGHFVYGC